jgi:diadenosine tetraphosphate (Ap4A) HIT family hydrolase
LRLCGEGFDLVNTCDLCTADGGQILWRDGRLRVVYVDEPGYPGYCRVIWNQHVREMSDLSETDRNHFMSIVFAVETVLRELLAPDKINLASLGNFTPHLHWHVIPRFTDDPHFPQAIWGERQRLPGARTAGDLLPRIARALAGRLG